MNKRICKLVSAFLVTLATVLGSLRATKADSFSVGSYADLVAAITGAATTINITITSSFEVEASIAVTSGKTVTITSDPSGLYTLSFASSFATNQVMFSVSTGGYLTLSDIILEGKSGRDASLIANTGTLTLDSGAVLRNNSSALQAGGAINNSGYGNVFISAGALITNNSSGNGGGGIASIGSATGVVMSGGTISNNSDTNGHGGGIYVQEGDLQIYAGEILNNTSTGNGGGIYLLHPSASGTKIKIQHATLSGNHADNDGGAIDYTPGSELYLNDVNFANNSAGKNGGAISVEASDLSKIHIEDAVFSNNTAVNGNLLTDSTTQSQHDQLITGATYTKPFVYAYNNFDIEYNLGDPVYVVWFDTDGGSAMDPVAVAVNTAMNKPTDPTKSNKVFAGWYEDDAYANKYDFNSLVSSNKTLYGKWVDATDEVEYLVVFDSNGGSAVASETVSYGDKVTKPVDPTKGGKVFAGWYSDDSFSNKYNFELPVTDDLTLYAKWVDSEAEISYVIFFNKNIPSGAVDGITSFPANAYLTSGNSFNITSALTPAGTPSKPGASYSFAGWGTSPTGAAIFKATAYHSGELFSSSTGKAILATIYGVGATINITDNDINLYAIWNVTNSSSSSGGNSGSGSGGSASAPLTGVPNVSGDFYPLILTMGIWLLVQNKKRKED